MTARTVRFAWMLAGVGAASAAVRAVALLKELLVAARFGTGDRLEAFLLALAVPMLVAGAFRSAILSSLVPRLAAAKQREGREAAGRLLAASLTRNALVTGAAAVGLALLSRPIVALVASGFPPEKQALTARLFVLLSSLVLLDGIAAVYSAALHADGRIGVSTLGMGFSPLVTLAALVVTSGAAPEVLVLGAVAGSLAEGVWSAAHLASRGWSPLAVERPWAPYAADAARGFAKLLVGSAIVSINPIVDQAMAAHLGAGDVAALGFGGRVVGGLLGIVAMAFGTAALSRYSMYVADGDREGLGRAYRRDAAFVLAFGTVAALALIAVSTPVTRLLYERGAFSSADTAEVARIQAFCAVQIPGYLVGVVGTRAMNVLGRDWEILVVAAAGAVLNVVGNLVLARWLGVAGIALSTGIVYTGTSAAVAWILRRALRT